MLFLKSSNQGLCRIFENNYCYIHTSINAQPNGWFNVGESLSQTGYVGAKVIGTPESKIKNHLIFVKILFIITIQFQLACFKNYQFLIFDKVRIIADIEFFLLTFSYSH